MKPTKSDALAAALYYAEQLGWRVFPVFEVTATGACACGSQQCESPGKHPRVKDWPSQATTDATKIRGWWTRWRNANVAILTGTESGIIVLDVDPRHDGAESLAILEEKAGDLPETLETKTGGGGRHLFFRHPGEQIANATKLGGYSGLDLRADRGYVIGPPSSHSSGGAYRWKGGQLPGRADLALLAPFPPALLALVGARERGVADAAPVRAERIPKGERNTSLTRAAGMMRRAGFGARAIRAALQVRNEELSHPPLSASEVKRIATSVSRYPTGARPPVADREAEIIWLSEVSAEEIEWLWFPYIPLRKATLLEGDPDLGKTWLALAIAAAVTRGWPLPGEDGIPAGAREPGRVLYLTAEDGLGDTLRPRLDRLGGDPARFAVPRGWRSPDGEFHPDIGLRDVDVLQDAIEKSSATLVVLDPLLAYLGTDVDAHRANETRPLMAQLLRLAEDTGCAVLGIRHFRKGEAEKALYRGLGSIDFAAAVRSILHVGEDPDQPGLRVLAHAKSNLAPKGFSIAFEIADGEFRWAGSSQLTAEDLARRAAPLQRPRDEAEAFLEERLAAGPLPTRRLVELAREAGIAERTLKRARKTLGVKSYPRGKPGKPGAGEWLCRLPGRDRAEDDADHHDEDRAEDDADRREGDGTDG